MARITVKVHPRARRTQLTGRHGDAFKLELNAPPVDGKANDACIRFFADLFDIPRARVSILLGLTNRVKVIEIEGVPQEQMDAKLLSCSISS